MKLLSSRSLMRSFLFIASLYCFPLLGNAQINVSGTLTGEGEPLIGASILIKGTGTGTVTDADGAYEINVPSDATLVFSYTGFATMEVLVEGRSFISQELQLETSTLEQVVVVGYGTQKKKEVTGAVARVEDEAISRTATPDLGTALQGLVAGVNVQASSGRPGDAANIQIRGLGSINPGSLGPLYVVDGIPFEGNPNIAPEQIKTIDILKDGAAASIYGTRASNGVILITTKRGAVGKMKVDFSSYGGVQNITSGTPLMNTQQQMYAEETRLNAFGRDVLIFEFNPNALLFDSDFVGDVQQNNAAIQNYNLNVSGGIQGLTLNINSNYFNQDGVLLNSGFDRLTNRITGEFTSGRFKAFATVGFTRENREQEPFALYEYAIAQMPWQPPLSGIESVGDNAVEIPVRNAILYSFLSQQLGNIDEREVNSNNVAINLQYDLLNGLSVRANLGRNNYDYRRKFFRPQYIVLNNNGSVNPTATRPQAQLNEDFISSSRETVEGILNYTRSFGSHNLNLTGVISYERFNSRAFATGVIFSEESGNDLQTLGTGSEASLPSSNNEVYTLSGKMVRAQYNYDDRYLLSASFRRDGSSRFSADNRYGNFLGFSAGWNVFEENWFQSEKISALKIRASWAQVGNQDIASYAFSPVIESGVNYPFGPSESLNFGFIQRRFVNTDIKWETTISRNIGIDLSLFDYRLNFSADFYRNTKEDMLLQERLAPSTGTFQPRAANIYDVKITNAGNMVNSGMEFSLNYQNRTNSGLKYQITSTFTRNVNEVTDLNGVQRGFANGRPVVSRGDNTDFTTFLAEGFEAGAFFLLENDGVIKTAEELEIYRNLDPSAQLGDIRYIDQNGDGTINDEDRIYAGSGQPEFEAGLAITLEYRNFDFFIQGYYSHGAEVYNGAKLYAYGAGRHADQFYQWSPQNPNSDIPADRQNAFHNNVRARSDFFLEDGTYLRIRNIAIGYTFPNMQKLGIDRFRIYLSSTNPFTFTNYTGYDPEVGGDGLFLRGIDRGNYPVARQFLAGLQLGF
ncbi:MAG: TonB-dependent receptor [Bacteroidota bacterium]